MAFFLGLALTLWSPNAVYRDNATWTAGTWQMNSITCTSIACQMLPAPCAQTAILKAAAFLTSQAIPKESPLNRETLYKP